MRNGLLKLLFKSVHPNVHSEMELLLLVELLKKINVSR